MRAGVLSWDQTIFDHFKFQVSTLYGVEMYGRRGSRIAATIRGYNIYIQKKIIRVGMEYCVSCTVPDRIRPTPNSPKQPGPRPHAQENRAL